ncbi:acyl carrier protein [Luteibacter sp. CQ10]|uniref:acyl carrier protein n=1 Tax=Luteibacter sp. CQ10 TaxID=2805821 RepID=UPI0034A43D32
MPDHVESIEALIARILSDTFDPPEPVTADTALLDLLDSIGMVIAMAEIQDALQVRLEPPAVIEAFQCATVADLAAVFRATRT